MNRVPGWRIQFLLLAAIWGASFLFINVLDRHWPALWVSFGRVALGAAALLLLVALRRERLPTGRRVWFHCAVAALLFNAVPWSLFAGVAISQERLRRLRRPPLAARLGYSPE